MRSLSKHCDDIAKKHRQLLSIFGTLKEVVLPTEQEIRKRAENLFINVNVEILEIPFSLESANHSLAKIIAGEPPSASKNQQFKDGVIWADCLDLSNHDDVALVTEDQGFYDNRQYGNGLAKNLRKEVADHPHDIRIFSSLNDLLEQIRVSIEIDNSLLVEEFKTETRDSISVSVHPPIRAIVHWFTADVYALKAAAWWRCHGQSRHSSV